jgi:hypothetical protein
MRFPYRDLSEFPVLLTLCEVAELEQTGWGVNLALKGAVAVTEFTR